MPTPRPLPWILGAALAGALLWLVFGQRDADPAAPAPRAGHGQPAPPAAPAPDPAAHHDHAAPGAAPGEPADPAVLGGEPADPEAMSMLPEPPGEDDIAERPARAPLTPEEQRQRDQRALALIDRSIERLEAERQAAEASGDARTAERNRVRIERLRQRRAVLTQPPPAAP